MNYGRAQRHMAKCLQFAHSWGEENIFVLTVTFKDRDITPEESQRRFNSFATNVFSKVCAGNYVKFLEFQKRGTPHYHVIFYYPGARVGSNFINGFWYRKGQAFKDMIELCSLGRDKYGFGRTTVEPVRQGGGTERVVKYLFKYFFKTMRMAVSGARFISFGRALSTGLCETLLSLGKRKREMLGAFCLSNNIEMEDIPCLAQATYSWLKPGLALLEFWRRDIVSNFEHYSVCPF